MGIGTEVHGNVGVVELQEPPHNFLQVAQVKAVCDAVEDFAKTPTIGAVVLAAQGRSFCAGANFGSNTGGETPAERGTGGSPEELYAQAARLVSSDLPIVAAVQGPAIGGGLGLAIACTMRVTCPEARFSANFVRLGIHQGFGLSVTLPELIGPSRASMVLLTGRRFKGDEATELGMADVCVPLDDVRSAAMALAAEIAEGAPLAIRAITRTIRAGLGDRVRAATKHEAAEQARLFQTEDAREGLAAVAERRPGRFVGK